MGACASKKSDVKTADQVQPQLDEDRFKDDPNLHNLLLIGCGEQGKSALFRQALMISRPLATTTAKEWVESARWAAVHSCVLAAKLTAKNISASSTDYPFAAGFANVRFCVRLSPVCFRQVGLFTALSGDSACDRRRAALRQTTTPSSI